MIKIIKIKFQIIEKVRKNLKLKRKSNVKNNKHHNKYYQNNKQINE